LSSKLTIPSFIDRLAWLVPFICFASGYFFLSYLYNVEKIETPNIIGKDLYTTFNILSSCNLNARLQATKEVHELAHGTVLNQIPAPGTLIKPNQNVYIVTSVKPQLQTAPKLINRSLSEIGSLLSAAGINNKVYYQQSNYPKNTCICHSPSYGEQIKDHKIITYISNGTTKPVILPNFKGKMVTTVLDAIKEQPIKVSLVHTTPQEHGHVCSSTCTVVDQRPLAGSMVTLDAAQQLALQLHVQS
jgi:beta-lactam-binding protein with PASTA domain